MKRIIPIIGAAVIALVGVLGLTAAYFTDRDTAESARAAAGYLDVSMDAELNGYGVPGDTQKLGSVTVTNNGPTSVSYELRLTAGAETAYLLDNKGKDAIILFSGGVKLSEKPLNDNGGLTLLYRDKLEPGGAEHTFDVALAFKGLDLKDGNDYQNHDFSISYEVNAFQMSDPRGGVNNE